jgi:hypothetical protein
MSSLVFQPRVGPVRHASAPNSFALGAVGRHKFLFVFHEFSYNALQTPGT